MRRITKGKVSKTVSIRTSQDTWIAFPRNATDTGWATLDDVDFVVAATVDDRDNPKFAQVHFIKGDEMRARFDRAYAARKEAGYTMPIGRGIWLSLYEKEASHPVTLVGGGFGLDHPPIARIALSGLQVGEPLAQMDEEIEAEDTDPKEAPLTIPEAKRRLAASLGVDESAITITVSH